MEIDAPLEELRRRLDSFCNCGTCVRGNILGIYAARRGSIVTEAHIVHFRETGIFQLSPHPINNDVPKEILDFKNVDDVVAHVRDLTQKDIKTIALERKVMSVEAEVTRLKALDGRWRIASGLNAGSDPSGMTPDIARQWWERVERERDEARAEVTRLMGEVESLGYMLANLRARNERWKQAIKEYFIKCMLDPQADTKMSVDAGFAIKDGNLEALEKAIEIKEKS